MRIRSLFLGFVVIGLTFSTFISCNTVAPDVMDMMDQDDMDTTSIMANPAPDFMLTSVTDTTSSLSEFAGKPLVIFFFGNACPLCKASSPAIQSNIVEGFSGEDITIIGIDMWDGNKAAVLNFRETTGLPFDLLLNGSSVGAAYSTTYDRLFVIDAEGNIAHQGGTAAGNDVPNVVAVLNELLE